MDQDIGTSIGNGCVFRGLPWSLDRHDPISIGSDRGCDIVIEGADSHHAELCWDADEEAWFVHDDPAPGLTLRNGTPIDSSRMFEGDELEIAGVHIRFAGGQLKEHVTTARLRVSLRDVSATAGGERRLKDISFEASPGTFAAILGPSGCGKSTLIQRIAGLASYEGDIFFNGHDLRKEADAIRPLMAYLPQAVEDSLYNDMTVRESMEDFARCHLATGATVDFVSALDDVKLADKIDEYVGKLSGGQKRRFALALALLRNPQLLLLDEPTAGLDPAAEADIMALLRRIADQGRTVLCATHILGSLDQCDTVLVLAPGGRQVFSNTPARVCDFFGTNDWSKIYQQLQDWDKPCKKLYGNTSPPAVADIPSVGACASAGRAALATFSRLVRSVVGPWRSRVFFIGSPIVIAVVLLVACWSIFKSGDLGTIYFCMSVAMFWLGLSGAVRNLVVERVPKRCLDRMRGMSLARYFSAHVAFMVFYVMLQALLFVLPVFLAKLGHAPFSMHALVPFIFILALVGFSGGCVGLFVSAAARKEIQAVWALPGIAIFALFMSKPVLEGGRGEKPEGLLRTVECVMPTLAPQTLLETSMDRARGVQVQRAGHSHSANIRHFTAVAVGYPVIFLTLAFFYQAKREEEWDGR